MKCTPDCGIKNKGFEHFRGSSRCHRTRKSKLELLWQKRINLGIGVCCKWYLIYLEIMFSSCVCLFLLLLMHN